MKRLACLVAVSTLVALGMIVPAGADVTERHTGEIISIAADGRAFVLAEVGPWQERYGEALVTERTITLTPSTEYAVVKRSSVGPGGFTDEFVETRVGPGDVRLGDYVTVVCRPEGNKWLAVKIIVNELP